MANESGTIYKDTNLYQVNGVVIANPADFDIPTDQIRTIQPAVTTDGTAQASFLFRGVAGTVPQKYQVLQNSRSLAALKTQMDITAPDNTFNSYTSVVAINSTQVQDAPGILINVKHLAATPHYDGTNTVIFVNNGGLTPLKITVLGNQTLGYGAGVLGGAFV